MTIFLVHVSGSIAKVKFNVDSHYNETLRDYLTTLLSEPCKLQRVDSEYLVANDMQPWVERDYYGT